jgi:hypothetical protein
VTDADEETEGEVLTVTTADPDIVNEHEFAFDVATTVYVPAELTFPKEIAEPLPGIGEPELAPPKSN